MHLCILVGCTCVSLLVAQATRLALVVAEIVRVWSSLCHFAPFDVAWLEGALAALYAPTTSAGALANPEVAPCATQLICAVAWIWILSVRRHICTRLHWMRCTCTVQAVGQLLQPSRMHQMKASWEGSMLGCAFIVDDVLGMILVWCAVAPRRIVACCCSCCCACYC
jgi:hypothetical protein